MPYRQSLWITDITLKAAGQSFHLGLADGWTGGEKTSDTGQFQRATGMKLLGGVGKRNQGTATYLYDETLHAIFKSLDKLVGNGSAQAVITRTPKADDGTPFAGGGYTLTGLLQELPMPDGKPDSSDGATIDLKFDLDTELA